jgi:hypothetical protein
MNFAPLPDFEGAGDYDFADDQSEGYGTQAYYASTQGSQFSQDSSAYMGGGGGDAEEQANTQGFSQESGYSDYYYSGGPQFSQDT